MSLVIIVFSEALAESFDGFVKFTYVNWGGTGKFMQMLDEGLQVVR